MTPLKFPVSIRTHNLPWEPNISERNSQHYLKVNPGTVNYMLPSNWQSEFILKKGEVNYVKLKVLSTSGGTGWFVTGCEYQVNTDAPKAVEPKQDSPPATMEFVVGIYYNGEYKMIFNTPIFIYPIIFYTTPKSNPTTGEESFDKYYIWQHA